MFICLLGSFSQANVLHIRKCLTLFGYMLKHEAKSTTAKLFSKWNFTAEIIKRLYKHSIGAYKILFSIIDLSLTLKCNVVLTIFICHILNPI